MKKITTIRPSAIKKMLNRKRVAAYCRVSTGSEEQLVSLENQKAHYEEYIVSNPEWEFAGLYYDEGITGRKKEKRPALMQMIQDCEAGLIDVVLTKSLSRFARNTTDCLELVRILQNLGVQIYFEKENLNTGKMESFLSWQGTEVQEYDNALVRRLVETITVYDDRFKVKFKPGIEIEVAA